MSADAALARLQAQSRFRVRQQITPLVNRYEIRVWNDDDSLGDVLALAQQKRAALKEQVTFYADADRQIPLFSFKARTVLDVSGSTDVLDAAGRPIGSFSKDFQASLLRSTYYLDQPGMPRVTGTERSQGIALARRFLAEWLPYHFDFAGPNGEPVLSVERKFAWGRDAYRVTVHAPGLDRRLAAAMSVALDVLQSR